jgi:putative ABC transport system substrate-binding protein
MSRRAFIALLGAAMARPLWARAQPPDRVQRVGVLMGLAESDAGAERRVVAFQGRLQELGWFAGQNIRIDYRWSAGEAERARSAARELTALPADVLVGHTVLPALALQQATSTIPIVFTAVSEPAFYGLVESLARPGRNLTGFTNFAPGLGGELLQLLKGMAPRVARVAVMFNPEVDPASVAFAGSAAAAAKPLAVETLFAPIYALPEIETVMTMLAREPGGGLILPPNNFTSIHGRSIIAFAARYGLPAIYGSRFFTAAGGLSSYGIHPDEQFRAVATAVDRILRGAKPADLPVQAPTKFELVINLKTAKALGLDAPPWLLARADEVIE